MAQWFVPYTANSARQRKIMLGNSLHGSGGFCRARAALGEYGKNRSKRDVGGRRIARRPGQRSTVVTEADTRATNIPKGEKRSEILICGPFGRNSRKPEEANGSSPKTALSEQDTSPSKPTPGVGK